MRCWKPGTAKTSEEPRFLSPFSPLENFEGRNRSSRVVLWHLCRLEDPLSRLCLSDPLDSGLKIQDLATFKTLASEVAVPLLSLPGFAVVF